DIPDFIEKKIPTVIFNYSKKCESDTGWATTDNLGISRVVASHLIQRGFRDFAFCGFNEYPWSVSRGEGFKQIIGEAGFEVSVLLTAAADEAEHDQEITAWLLQLPRPVAVMAANDELGRRIVSLCNQCGIRVPDDCAVVGVDNDLVVCGMSNPPLSSVSVDQHRSGYEAAAMLHKMMNGEVLDHYLIEAQAGELTVRQSSDVVAVEDIAVAKALKFIHQNGTRPLKVDDVVFVSGVHRRSLEKRFRDHLSRSIQQYCRESRAEYVAKILRESRMSLEEIAEQCGFPEASHLTRFFISMRGEAPSKYRKRVLLS
ncbi:MAG: substrate-binding domain-containing protein, partial [Verrucomicrobiota bacterium]